MAEPTIEEHRNPYATPEAQVRGGGSRRRKGRAKLANPWLRLVAVIIDGLIMSVIVVPVMFMLGVFDNPSVVGSWETTLVLAGVGLLSYLAINGYLLTTRGQTVGKMAMSVKIVRVDNSLASFGQVVGLRYMLMQAIGMIPLAGTGFAFIDALFIFRADRRCIHDLIAGTKVIKA